MFTYPNDMVGQRVRRALQTRWEIDWGEISIRHCAVVLELSNGLCVMLGGDRQTRLYAVDELIPLEPVCGDHPVEGRVIRAVVRADHYATVGVVLEGDVLLVTDVVGDVVGGVTAPWSLEPANFTRIA